MNHHLLHKTKKHNYIKKKTRKYGYGKKSSVKKLSKRKRYTRKMLRKGGVKFSFGATRAQASFLNDFFPDEKKLEQFSRDVKFPYNVTFDNKGSFMGADFRYYVPRRAVLSSKKYKNLSLDEYSEITSEQQPYLIQHRKNKITYFNAITRILDTLFTAGKIDRQAKPGLPGQVNTDEPGESGKVNTDEPGQVNTDEPGESGKVNTDEPGPDPRPSDIPNTLYQTSLMEISEDDLNRLLNNPDTSSDQIIFIEKEIGTRNGYEVNSEVSPIIKLLNYSLWFFDREIVGRCVIYKRKLNGENITISSGHGRLNLAFFVKATIAGKEESVGFTLQSQHSSQFVKIRFIILMICIMFDMNQVSPEIQNNWFENIKNTEEVFISNSVELSSIQNETLETLRERHLQFFQNYLQRMISIITDLFEKHPRLKNYMIAEIDLYYLTITMNPSSFFHQNAVDYQIRKTFKHDLDVRNMSIIINQLDANNTKFSQEDTQIINHLFGFKPPDSITKYLENVVTTNIEVDEKNHIVLHEHILFGITLTLPPSDERALLAIILDEKTVNITNSTYVSLSKFRWVFNTETQLKIYRIIGPRFLEELFPYFRSIIPIDQLNPQQFNVKYDRAVLLYTGYVKNSLSMGPSLVRSVQNMFQGKPVPMTLPVAKSIPLANTPVRSNYGSPNPRYQQAMMVSNMTQAVVDSSNTQNNDEKDVEV